MSRRVGVLVPAAGSGERMGGVKKPFVLVRGEPLLLHALRPLLGRRDVVAVRIALAPGDAIDPPAWLRGLDRRITCVAGGATRSASVRAALDALPDVDVVVVHDGARPLLTPALLERCIAASGGEVAAAAGWPASDTLKQVDDAGRVVATPDRSRLWHAQTPQAFAQVLIRRAYEAWDGSELSDDAALVERAGGTVVMVEGPRTNLKVTRPEDVAVAEALLAAVAPGSSRAGPVHPLPSD